jgi:hypothetical protein
MSSPWQQLRRSSVHGPDDGQHTRQTDPGTPCTLGLAPASGLLRGGSPLGTMTSPISPDAANRAALRRTPVPAHRSATTNRRSAGEPVIRRALDREQVLAAVESVDFLKDKLAGQTEAQKRGGNNGKETIRARVKGVLRKNAELFGADDAMSMAIVIDAVAQAISEELYDTSLKPAIARHLLETFRADIKKAMPVRGHRTIDLDKATAVVSTDALARYMHGERKLNDAAWDIRDEAVKAGLKPVTLYDMLSKKFQAQLASYTFATVRAQQDTKTGFNQSEITGSVSVNYLKELFGDAIDTTPDATMPVKHGGGGLEFTADSQKRLDDLRQAVKDADKPGATDPRPTNAKQRRARLFADIKEADKAVRNDRESQVRAALMAAPWNLTQSKATAVINTLKKKLPALLLTITHDPDRRLPTDVAAEIDAVDRSRAGVRENVSVAGKDFASPGKWKGTDRPEDYMRFRTWKDRVMTGNMGMEGTEMPVFGAVNPFFKNTKGTGEGIGDQYEATKNLRDKGKKNWSEKDKKDAESAKKYRDKDFAKNYYGTIHLVLKRKAVEGRVLYTASDHGVPHADPFLTFADFLLGSQAGYQADVTRLKRPGAGGFVDKSTRKPEQRNTEIVQPEYAAAIIAAVLGSKKAVAWTLPFEVQIHGGVDWRTDVSEIWVAPAAKDEVFDRLVAWSKAGSGRPKVRRAKPPSSDDHISVVDAMAASGRKHART